MSECPSHTVKAGECSECRVTELESNLAEARAIIGATPYARICELEAQLAKAREANVVILTPAQCEVKIKKLEAELAETRAESVKNQDMYRAEWDRDKENLAACKNEKAQMYDKTVVWYLNFKLL